MMLFDDLPTGGGHCFGQNQIIQVMLGHGLANQPGRAIKGSALTFGKQACSTNRGAISKHFLQLSREHMVALGPLLRDDSLQRPTKEWSIGLGPGTGELE